MTQQLWNQKYTTSGIAQDALEIFVHDIGIARGGMTKLSFTPTHYMPLPTPPTKDLADAGKEKT